jgi:sugar lactone lactonase YvrE
LVDPSGDLWASSYGNDDVTEYAPGVSGNVSPINAIGGSYTQLSEPLGMAMNAKGQLFVANGDAGTIVVFAKGASGNATPLGVIGGGSSGLSKPFALAFDDRGRLLVADENSGILVFAKGAIGDVTPAAWITSVSYPAGVMGDSKGHIYAAEFSNDTIKEFAHNATGNATPLRTIEGPYTTLDGPNSLAH